MGVGYQDLIVWQKSMDLVLEIYQLVKTLPKEERYALSDQMRRAAVSIPSNIAEGKGRNSKKELVQFLYIARGSVCELNTQIMICQKLKYISDEKANDCIKRCEEIGVMLYALINRLK